MNENRLPCYALYSARGRQEDPGFCIGWRKGDADGLDIRPERFDRYRIHRINFGRFGTNLHEIGDPRVQLCLGNKVKYFVKSTRFWAGKRGF